MTLPLLHALVAFLQADVKNLLRDGSADFDASEGLREVEFGTTVSSKQLALRLCCSVDPSWPHFLKSSDL